MSHVYKQVPRGCMPDDDPDRGLADDSVLCLIFAPVDRLAGAHGVDIVCDLPKTPDQHLALELLLNLDQHPAVSC